MRTTTRSSLMQAAARSRIVELAEGVIDRMTSEDRLGTSVAADDRTLLRSATRQMWALGDYHAFAKATVWDLGPALVQACGITKGQRVLDVAAGSGNTAIRAAEAGARVVASDLTPELLEAGRREADALGVDLEWVEADVQDLPFDESAFDAVTSSFGAMFAPDHRVTAHEMLRVCRPGGAVGMLNFTPDGLAGAFFGTLAPYMPPSPPGALPPLMWGDDEHVRQLFEEHVDSLLMTRGTYVERAASPAAYRDLFKATFGPVVATYAGLAEQPDRLAALDEDFLRFAVDSNRAVAVGPAEYEYEYLLVVARKRLA